MINFIFQNSIVKRSKLFFNFQILTKSILVFSSLFLITEAFAQRNNNNTYTVITLNFTYGAHLPGGDLSNRFGNNFSLGGGLDLITEKKKCREANLLRKCLINI